MKKDLIPTGQIVNTHGLKGFIKVMPWADSPDILTELDRFFIDGKEYAVEYAAKQKSMVLLKLEGVDSIDDAAKLRDKEICLCRADLALEEGTVFIADLIGLPVLANGQELGVIKDVLTPPGNDVYVVEGECEYLIPVVKEFVEEINIDAGYVKVRLIEGMRTNAD